VTLCVLTVSDLDFFFSILFLGNLTHHFHDQIYYTCGPFIIGAGILTYLAGIIIFGPRQKAKVMEKVLKLMATNPQEFQSDIYREKSPDEYITAQEAARQGLRLEKVAISLESPVHPSNPRGRPQFRKIGQLDKSNKDHRELFRKGLSAWGLGYMWEAADLQNSWNCTSPVHGLPMVRLARFGFMVQPSPVDLGGLLNANALYSFATGGFQLFLGCMLLHDYGYSLETVIPLAVSSVALVLCLANVIWDFAALLMKMDAEKRLADTIIMKNDAAKAREHDGYRQDMETKTEAIRQRYPRTGQMTPAQELALDDEMRGVNDQFSDRVHRMNGRYGDLLEREMNAWRENLERERRLMRDGRVPTDSNDRTNHNTEAINNRDAVEKQEAQINAAFRNALSELNPANMSAEEFAAKMEQIKNDRDAKLKAFDDMRTALLA